MINQLITLPKKIKKLEKQIRHGRRRRRRISSSDSDSDIPPTQLESEEVTLNDNNVIYNQEDSLYGYDYLEPTTDTAEPAANAAAVATSPPRPNTEIVTISPTPKLDPELLEILGDDPTSIKDLGPAIQKDLAVKLTHIVCNGLSKENRKELKEKYIIPSNCTLIKTPTLNPEIRASLQDRQAKRDKGIEYKQGMTSCALSSLSTGITLLLSSGYKNPELLKILMDTARILGDIQYNDSMSRRFFILSTIQKGLKDGLQKTKIDETLFGTNLSEILKSTKSVNRLGADIRSSTIKNNIQRPAATYHRTLNWRAPPTNRRGGATANARTPRLPPPPQTPVPVPRRAMTTAQTTQHSGYRTSSRQPPPRHRR